MNSTNSDDRSRGWSRRRKLVVAAFVSALVVAVPVALASHQFTDVPDSNPFHDDISAVKDAGITSGKTCVPPGTPPTYCPSEGITREAMAAFVHRGFGRAGTDAGNATVSDATDTDVAVVTISVGGAAGGTQFVVLNGSLTGEIQQDDTGCPCETRLILTRDGVGLVAGPGYFVNSLNFATSVDGQFNTASGALNTVVMVPTGTTQTFRLVAQRDGGGSPGSVFYYGNLSAMTVPFGSTGTATAAVPNAPKRLSARG